MEIATIPVAVHAGRRIVSGGGFSLTEARYQSVHAEGRHSHPHDLLAFALRGSATLGWGQTRTDCTTLGLSIVPGGVEHTHLVSGGCRCLILECGSGGLSVAAHRVLFARPRIIEKGLAAGFGLRLNREFREADDLSPLAIENLLLLLMVGLDGDSAGRSESKMPPWLARVRDRIHAEFRGRFRIADLAVEASVHPVYLVRAFRRWLGVPPAAYVRRLRLAEAARSLVESKAKLSEVAKRSGYADQSQFTRHFTRVAGQSPGAFRKALVG